MLPAYLKEALPEFDSLNEKRKYERKKQLVNFLKSPRDMNLSSLTEAWEAMTEYEQNLLHHEYQCNYYTSLSDILIETKNAKTMMWLMKRNFKFNQADLHALKKENWLAYSGYESECIVVSYGMFSELTMYWLILCHKIKKLLKIKKPALYMIEYFSADMLKVLLEHIEILPEKLRFKVMREAPEALLVEMEINKGMI